VPIATRRVPTGPTDAYDTSQDLLSWMADPFQRFGSIYRASIYCVTAYVISAPEHVERILLKNWQNYTKGLAIKRIASLLGNGLNVSTGGFCKSQRRMMQPAFQRFGRERGTTNDNWSDDDCQRPATVLRGMCARRVRLRIFEQRRICLFCCPEWQRQQSRISEGALFDSDKGQIRDGKVEH
jgi:hypothetical protein